MAGAVGLEQRHGIKNPVFEAATLEGADQQLK